jgi:RNA polymerase sigma-70 factor (ECF subfamily)
VKSIAAIDEAGLAHDGALVSRAASGELAAFDLLIATRLDRCYRLALAILGNEADAHDATQEGVVNAWRQLPRLRNRDAFDPWLNRIVANAARMSRRHRVRLREIHFEPADDGLPAGPAANASSPHGGGIEPIAGADAVARAFRRLREGERVILVLHHLEARPLTEIARTLGIAVGTAKWRLHEARKALERAMEAEA